MKDWTADLEAHVEEWSNRLEQSGRGWWPHFIYHFTDIQNACSILETGELLSRAECERRGLMENDNADPEIIEQTRRDHLDFVRLYFRPRTPTLFHVEGIKRRARRDKGHCPCPVYFLFDLVETIGRDDAHFSRGTLASSSHGYSQRRDYFRSIEFEDVYHDEGLGVQETLRKREIIQRRQAEVIIPTRLPIGDTLKGIYCRSPGERQSLLHLLDDAVADRWRDRIRVAYNKMFLRHRPFVHTASGSGDTVEIELSKSSWQSYQYDFAFQPEDREVVYRSDGEISPNTKNARFQLSRPETGGILSFELEGCQAFSGYLSLSELPF